MKKVFVTTSWDDGCKLDLKLAELLRTYGLSGTFYISPEDREIRKEDRLSEGEIFGLSKEFEIGAHTMTHPRLTKVDDVSAESEILSSKKYLEKITGKKVLSFCYPGGAYFEKHKTMVRKAGFSYARTVNRFSNDLSDNKLESGTTVHAYRHWSDIFQIFRHAGFTHFYGQYLNWDELAISLFEKTYREGGVFHLWGHSWEIDKNKDWARLERVFKHISNREGIAYVSNDKTI